MAVVDLDQLHLDLDRIADITTGRIEIADPRARALTLMHLWLGVYSSARDRAGVSLYPLDEHAGATPLHRLAAVASAEFFYYHALHEELAPPE